MSKPASLSVLVLLLGFVSPGRSPAQRSNATAGIAARAVAAAEAFARTLDEPQRAKLQQPLTETSRAIWSNLPTGSKMQVGATERNGVKFGDLSPAQQEAALALLSAVLSPTGHQKVRTIVTADQVLEDQSAATRAAGSRTRFGRAEYYIAFLGKPSVSDLWMIQFGGHHLAINVTVGGRSAVLTPSHTGAQPASYTLEGRTVRPLGAENDKAFALINALDAAQQKQAILGYTVGNLVLGPGLDGKVIAPEGVRVSAFDAKQRALLLDLVSEWVNILNADASAAKMAEIEKNLPETWFAWQGQTTNGNRMYFRVQGPTVLIEYAPQGQTGTDHIHTIYRDPTNDYGPKLAAR
jgi:hypothetical protein